MSAVMPSPLQKLGKRRYIKERAKQVKRSLEIYKSVGRVAQPSNKAGYKEKYKGYSKAGQEIPWDL